MTTGLFDDIAAAPDTPVEPLFSGATIDDSPVMEEAPSAQDPKRTRRPRGRPRKPRPIDPETGEEVEAPKRKYQPRTQKLEDDILEEIVSVASDLSAFAPTVAGVMIVRAEAASKGMVALAKGHPRALSALQKSASAGQVFGLLSIALMLLIAVAVDFGKIAAESPLLDAVGYAEVERDENGKMKRDDRGKAVKERMTLRDIRNTMLPESDQADDVAFGGLPHWSGMGTETGSGPITVPPMNWSPRT